VKYATFRHAGRSGVGVLTPGGDHLQPLLLPDGAATRGLLALLEHPAPPADRHYALDEVELLAPISHPRRNLFSVLENSVEAFRPA